MIEYLYVNGLVLVENFLTNSEELEIVSKIPETPSINKHTRNSVRRYGSKTPYKNQIESEIIPEYLDKISLKIVSQGYLTDKPNSVSINEYLTGNSIAPHIDSLESGEIITIVSLLCNATMIFTFDSIEHKLDIPSRSLIQLKDELRYKWKHSILPVKSKRYSIVFRNG